MPPILFPDSATLTVHKGPTDTGAVRFPAAQRTRRLLPALQAAF